MSDYNSGTIHIYKLYIEEMSLYTMRKVSNLPKRYILKIQVAQKYFLESTSSMTDDALFINVHEVNE